VDVFAKADVDVLSKIDVDGKIDVDVMEADENYAWLMDGARKTFCDPVDVHVIASAFALAMAETKATGLRLCERTGLTGAALTEMMSVVFPHALGLLEPLGDRYDLFVPEDERSLRELLTRFSTRRTPLQLQLAVLIARRAMRPNHLWQDLGLRNRGELGALMSRHFEPLARRNVNDMKWKKFLYRMICRDEGFRLCTAPSCSECDDFAVCFGDESGESVLAQNRRKSELLPTVLTAKSLRIELV
jgi:nitrogen fixation protein NifQ